jgi:hypothetical protein
MHTPEAAARFEGGEAMHSLTTPEAIGIGLGIAALAYFTYLGIRNLVSPHKR